MVSCLCVGSHLPTSRCPGNGHNNGLLDILAEYRVGITSLPLCESNCVNRLTDLVCTRSYVRRNP
ncbi:hypothetical protein J6590_067226 [Homalodisca vitripennis]|nr:hypothetical protein J6590_067226 [Homalodisca vitripennis]